MIKQLKRGRPSLPEGKKRINASFTMDADVHGDLLNLIPAGERSVWLSKVVTKALRGVRNAKLRKDAL